AAEPQAQTAEPQPERRAPLTKQGAFESARQRARELFTPREEPATETVETEAGPKEPVVDARGRKHDPATGKFLPSGEEATAAEAQPPGAEVAEPEAAPEEPHGVRIELPEGDIRRIAGGREYVTVPKEVEPLVRWSINNHVRRAEVETERQARKEIEKQLLRLMAEQSASSEWEQTPEYKAAATEYREIFESVRDRLIDQGMPEQEAIEAAKARADKYWHGVAAPQLRALADQKYQEQVRQVEEIETQKAAEAWVNEAWSNVTTQIPREIRELPQFRQWFEAAITAFDAEIAAGLRPDV